MCMEYSADGYKVLEVPILKQRTRWRARAPPRSPSLTECLPGAGCTSRTCRRGSAQQRKPVRPKHTVQQRASDRGVSSSQGEGWVPKTTLHINLHSGLQTSRAKPKRKYNTHRQGLGDCSTPKPKRTGGRAAHLTADRVLEDEESDQAAAQAQARQVQLEGKDSIVRFLRRTATGSPEWGREHARPHTTEEDVYRQTSIEEQTPAHGTNSPDTSTDTDNPTGGTRAHRPLSCPAPTTGHHDSAVFNASLSQAGTALLPALIRVLFTTADSPIQYYNSAVDFSPPGVTPQTYLHKDLFVTADTANQYANKPEEFKPSMNNVTTIAQVVGELEWSPVQAEQTETAKPLELSSAPCANQRFCQLPRAGLASQIRN
ncbi:hypothetical protein NDU88_005058 [Pleurodeles waltl]|uniref:Uncharacterized protein n=1 Tax=Pleurodeles waltl TaxID=8319 RepID=A0AAV7LLT0_PLEWA|nr:hypothetical protein NDU88_005058 [Pleurodeles waltl]